MDKASDVKIWIGKPKLRAATHFEV